MKNLIIVLLFISVFTSAQTREFSFYYGIGTRHVTGNEYLNNNNDVMILKYGPVLAGKMNNSYNTVGNFIGYQPTVYTNDKWSVDIGASIVTGYSRFQVPFLTYKDLEQAHEPVLVVLPIASVSYALTDNFRLQVNNMAGIVFNWGVRLDF